MGYAAMIEFSPNQGWAGRNASSPRTAIPVAVAVPPRVTRTQADDQDAFTQMALATQGIAYRLAYRLLQNEELATDAVQEALIKALRALSTCHGDNMKAWFLRILTNTCYDLLRQQKRRATTSLDELVEESGEGSQLADSNEEPEAYAERMELRHWIERGISTLPIDQRLAILLCDVEGYSYQEISEITGVPMNTVKSRISRGRTRLRDFLLRHRVLVA